MSMNSSIGTERAGHPRPELLAAFVDGRLRGRERAEMVAHLDACPDCYEELTETVRFLQEEEPGGQVVAIGRDDRSRSMRPLFWTAAAVAAVLLAVVIVPGWLDRPGAGGADLGAARLASALASPERAAGHIVSRSAPGAIPTFGAGGVSYFEAGVATVDLRVALAARDRGRALGPARVLSGLSSDLVSVVERGRWEDAGRETSAIERSLSEGEGAQEFLAGARAEAGRLAAATGDATFFRSEPGRAAYEALSERLDGAASAPDDLQALEKEFESWISNS